MSSVFKAADKAAMDALVVNVNGLKENWLTGPNGVGSAIIKKDSDGNVTHINLYEMGLTGSVDLTNLPPKVKVLNMGSNKLSGHLDLTQLPSSLEWLNLGSNSFTTIKIDNLPKSLESLYVHENLLRGVILKPTSVTYFNAGKHFRADDNKDLIVCNTQEEYNLHVTRCVRMLRAATSSTHSSHEAFKLWNVAQQTTNFLMDGVEV